MDKEKGDLKSCKPHGIAATASSRESRTAHLVGPHLSMMLAEVEAGLCGKRCSKQLHMKCNNQKSLSEKLKNLSLLRESKLTLHGQSAKQQITRSKDDIKKPF